MTDAARTPDPHVERRESVSVAPGIVSTTGAQSVVGRNKSVSTSPWQPRAKVGWCIAVGMLITEHPLPRSVRAQFGLGDNVVCYTFVVRDLHSLLLAGLPAH
jgi:hypothetical protein